MESVTPQIAKLVKEAEEYTTNDAYRKYFYGLSSDYIVVP